MTTDQRPLALIVDDEPDIRELLEITLSRMQIDTSSAPDLATARALLQTEQPFDLCLTDMRLPDGSGLELVAEINRNHPQLPVAVITAHGNMETAIQALKDGAFDFVSKPIDLEILRKLVQTALKLQPAAPAEEVELPPSNQLLGKSSGIEELRLLTRKVARTQAPVQIWGESGTGKELVARLIHQQSPRAEQAFIAVNCGAVPSELMESEFFGHRKGSFTGANSDKVGFFQAAEGGTLFLDEIADLPMHMQVKLLRAIQERAIRPIGEQHEIPVDVRIVSATHKNLARLVEEGLFRQDLYYRINVIEIEIPPLRDRRKDLPALMDYLLNRIAAKNQIPRPTLSPEASEALCRYSFPGNVRELDNILERAVALCDNHLIQPQDLRLPQHEQETPDLPDLNGDFCLETHLEKIERQIISETLEQTRWNRTAAAKKLGISFRALRYKLEKLGLDQG